MPFASPMQTRPGSASCNHDVTAASQLRAETSGRLSGASPVARKFSPVHVCTSKVVRRMASRRGLEPLTPGLGNLIRQLSNQIKPATIARNCCMLRARVLREKRGRRAPTGHKSGHSPWANRICTPSTVLGISARKSRGGSTASRSTQRTCERRGDCATRGFEVIKAQARHGAIGWTHAVVTWAEHMKGQIASSTYQRYWQSLTLCEPYLIDRMVGSIDGETIRGIVAVRRRAVGVATVRRDLTAISRVLAYAQSVGWREGNPALDAIRLLRERRDPIVLPDEGSIQAVFAKCSPALRNLAVAARLTGARQAELTALKWPQLNETAGTIEILKGKGNRRRVIALSPAALDHIARLPRTSDLIFPSADGPWVSVSPAFAKTVRRGAPRVAFRFHDLRHLYAVEALQRYEHLSSVAALGAHKRQDD